MSVFLVESQPGASWSDKLAAACSAALKAIPSTVVLPDREIALTRYQSVRRGVSVEGYGDTRSRLFLDYPGASAPSGNSPFGLAVSDYIATTGHPSVLSGFSIRARPTGYYRLITGRNTAGLTLRDLDFGVCGQSFVHLSGCSAPEVIRCRGAYGGDNSWDGGSAKYKISVDGCTDALIDDVTLGDPTHDRNQSFVTVNASHGVIVRNSRFYGTRTYDLNTHGTGSTGIVFENNLLVPGANAHFGAVLVGNEYYGPDLDVTLRQNVMEGPGRFLEVRAGSKVTIQGYQIPPCVELIGFGPGLGTVCVTG